MSLGVEFDVGVAHAGGAIGPLTDSGSGALTGDTVGLSGGIELGANGPGEIAASTLEGIGAHLSGEGEQPLLMGGERRLCVGRQPTGGSGHRIEVRATHTTSAERGLEEGHIGAEPLAVEGVAGVAPGATVVVDERGDGRVGSAGIVQLAHASCDANLEGIEPSAHRPHRLERPVDRLAVGLLERLAEEIGHEGGDVDVRLAGRSAG